MLDIKFIRQNREQLQQVITARGMDLSVAELLALDDKQRAMRHQVEERRSQRNLLSAKIAMLLKEEKHETANALRMEAQMGQKELARLEPELAELEHLQTELMLKMPNVISPDTPHGLSDANNVELKRVGKLPEFDFDLKDHVTLAQNLDMVDLPRGVKIAGSRGYFLKNAGLFLHRAVQQLAIDLLADKGYTVMDVPLLVRESALTNTGFFPDGRDQTYRIQGEDKWLVGTSEVSLVSHFADEIVDMTEPIRLAGVSNCFRKEAGSAGRDVHGLYRVHQFAKVEQVVLCRNDVETSERMFSEITNNAEEILGLLELPYRVVAVCTGDLSYKNYKQYDIETWMPSRNNYGETHSSSILLDFQARRSNIRYRDDDGALRHCHTLNNTAVASPRILIPLLENHQRADGSLYIPKALRKYMSGVEELRP